MSLARKQIFRFERRVDNDRACYSAIYLKGSAALGATRSPRHLTCSWRIITGLKLAQQVPPLARHPLHAWISIARPH